MAFLPSSFYKGIGQCLTCEGKISHDVEECPHCGKKSNSWGMGPTDWGKHQFSTTRGKLVGISSYLLIGIIAVSLIVTFFF